MNRSIPTGDSDGTRPAADVSGGRHPGAGEVGDVRLEHLVGLFYGPPANPSDLAQFQPVSSVPPPYDRLLDHHEHMTVTVEAFHGQKVDVVVHRTVRRDRWYAREITLVGARSRRVVQYGIVRLDVAALGEDVWRRIEQQQMPLGRVLIEHNVLRKVQLQGLWCVHAGAALASLLEVSRGETVYGRTARIYCDREPAIELLEIVIGSESQ